MLQKQCTKTAQNAVLGRHIIAEAEISDHRLLNDDRRLLDAVIIASKRAGMTVISSASHRFSPQGATAIALLAESHVSIHTWPEHNYAAIDVYTCGKNPEHVLEELKKLLPLNSVKVMVVDRGPA